MTRLAYLFIGAIAAAGLAAPVAAQPKLDPKLSTALACTSIAQADARLVCFDRAMAEVRKAAEAGTLNIGISDPVALTGAIKDSGESGFRRYWVLMDSGDRWTMHAAPFDDVPRKGAKVTIIRAPISGFWFQEQGMPDRRATFVGRSTPE